MKLAAGLLLVSAALLWGLSNGLPHAEQQEAPALRPDPGATPPDSLEVVARRVWTGYLPGPVPGGNDSVWLATGQRTILVQWLASARGSGELVRR